MTKESIYELQRIDCNCNNCSFLERDFEKFKFWEQWNRDLQEEDFNRRKEKAIKDAKEAILNAKNEADKRSCEGVLHKALKMKFQFNRDWLIYYGKCLKLHKDISFIPNICQIETQKCFIHRKDYSVL